MRFVMPISCLTFLLAACGGGDDEAGGGTDGGSGDDPGDCQELTLTSLEDTTLPAGTCHLLDATRESVVGSKLVIEPGVTLIIEEGQLDVLSEMEAIGTEEDPILITGADKEPGSWGGIYVRHQGGGGDEPGPAVFEHVIVEYGGEEEDHHLSANANIAWDHNRPPVHIVNSEIRQSETAGVRMIPRPGDDHEFSGNVITDNDVPLQIHEVSLPFLGEGNSFAGNVRDFIEVSTGAAGDDPTLRGQDVPYLFDEDFRPGGDLEIEAGAHLVFTPEHRLVVNHSITAIGTDDEPIIMQGRDEQPGAWGGVRAGSGTDDNYLEHVEIRHGGDVQGTANLWVSGTEQSPTSLELRDVHLAEGAREGLFVGFETTSSGSYNVDLTCENVTFEDNQRGPIGTTDPDGVDCE